MPVLWNFHNKLRFVDAINFPIEESRHVFRITRLADEFCNEAYGKRLVCCVYPQLPIRAVSLNDNLIV